MSAIARRLRVVIVGFGPVGARLCDELLPAVEAGAIDLTVIGAERHAPYNRVLLAELAVDHLDVETLTLHDTQTTSDAGVRLHLDTRVTAIDRERQIVLLATGETVPYDRLVLATGARANIPTLSGVVRQSYDVGSLARSGQDVMGSDPSLPRGVTVLRDLGDAERVRAAVQARARIVVLGAGVLGLEFALLAAKAGASVTVLHNGPTPMPRNLDRGAGVLLSRALGTAGVSVHAHSRAEAVAFRTADDGVHEFDALVTAEGAYVRGDLLVLSCGVGARVELAAIAGLRTAAGVVVDEHLRCWDDERISAIGDCAHVVERTAETETMARLPGMPSGLIGPGWRQAEWLARRLRAEAQSLEPPAPLPIEKSAVVMLKSDDIDVVATGDVDIDLWDAPFSEDGTGRQIAQWADPQHGRYLKLVSANGVIEGFACVGMPRTGAELTLLHDRRGELPADRSLLLRMDAAGEDAFAVADAFAPTATICDCNGVAVQRIRESITDGNDTIARLGQDTRAGTGCGGCKPRLAELIERFASSAEVTS